MRSFENRQLQLKTKSNSRNSESLVQPPEDAVKSTTIRLMAWTQASGQLNPDNDKYFIFQQNSQSPSFTSERLQIKYFLSPTAGPRASSQLNPDQDNIF